MTLQTVTIATISVEVYGGLTAAKAYHAVSSAPASVRFTALTTDEAKARRLLDATRYIDSLPWVGIPTDPAVDSTTLKWPRTDVQINVNGTATDVDPDTVPADILQAVYDLAAMLVVNPALSGAADQASNIQSLGAGPAQIAFFAPTSIKDGTATVLPPNIDRLVAKYLNGGQGSSARGGRWNGESCDDASAYTECAQYKRGSAF